MTGKNQSMSSHELDPSMQKWLHATVFKITQQRNESKIVFDVERDNQSEFAFFSKHTGLSGVDCILEETHRETSNFRITTKSSCFTVKLVILYNAGVNEIRLSEVKQCTFINKGQHTKIHSDAESHLQTQSSYVMYI